MTTNLFLPAHKDIAEQLLRVGSLFVHLDPRRAGVIVPPWLTHQAQVVLQFGRDLKIPIPDMIVGDAGIAGTLSFSRTPYGCNVPWSAVFAMVGDTGRGMVWPDHVPAEIQAEIEREESREDSKIVNLTVLTAHEGGRAGREKRKTPRGTLRLV